MAAAGEFEQVMAQPDLEGHRREFADDGRYSMVAKGQVAQGAQGRNEDVRREGDEPGYEHFAEVAVGV